MARGFAIINVVVDAGDSRPIAPGGAGLTLDNEEKLYINWIILNVLSNGVGSCVLTDSSGAVLTQIDCSVPFNSKEVFYPNDARRLFSGRPLPVGSPLTATVTAGQVGIDVGYEVR